MRDRGSKQCAVYARFGGIKGVVDRRYAMEPRAKLVPTAEDGRELIEMDLMGLEAPDPGL
jgi:hypothetical protein